MSVATELPLAPESVPAPAHGTLRPWLMVLFLMVLLTSSFIDRMILSLLVKPIRGDLGIRWNEVVDTSYFHSMARIVNDGPIRGFVQIAEANVGDRARGEHGELERIERAQLA